MIRLFALLSLLSMTAYADPMALVNALEDPRPSKNILLPLGGPATEKTTPSAVLQVARQLAPRLEQIRKERKVYYWSVASVRDRTPYYCIEQCACLVRDLKATLVGTGYPVRRLNISIMPRKDYEVRLRTPKGKFMSFTGYHQVLVVKIAGRWRVVDPLILGNTVPERLSVWLNRIDRRETKLADIL